MNTPADCPLCRTNNLLKTGVIAEAPGGYLIPAMNSRGNYLIIPSQHTESFLELPDNWWASVKTLLARVPDLARNYNISVNYGKHAGQSVNHLHFWVIPRVAGQPASGKGFARLISEANQR